MVNFISGIFYLLSNSTLILIRAILNKQIKNAGGLSFAKNITIVF